MKPKIPRFYLVSSDPDRENTEDYLRNNFDKSKFYENKEIIMPARRIHGAINQLSSQNLCYSFEHMGKFDDGIDQYP